jgi:hypothetical protein
MVSRLQHTYTHFPPDWRCVKVRGTGPFVSQVVFRRPDGTIQVWESRRHRKGKRLKNHNRRNGRGDGSQHDNFWLQFWKPQEIGWWITIASVIGSVFYVLGASVSLFYELLFFEQSLASTFVNSCYLGGSSIIIISLYLELLETINADENKYIQSMSRRSFRWWAWQPRRICFWSVIVPMIGVFLFNVETVILLLDAQIQYLRSVPRSIGCIFFVLGNYIGFVEVCHRAWVCKPTSLQWWMKFLQLFGALCFLVGAVVGINVPGLSSPEDNLITKLSYFVGTILFLGGSCLMLPELSSD